MVKQQTLLLILLMLTLADITRAQTPVDTSVSKNISKTIQLKPGDIFSVVGEKARVSVTGWNKSYVELKISFSAEHTDKTISTKEVEYMHYALTRERNTVELRNAFILPSNTDRILSRVTILMELMVPSSNALSVYNKYGDTEISDFSGKISVTQEFSDLTLTRVSGEIDIRSSYSEVRGDDGLTFNSFISHDEESKFMLTLDGGSYVFNSKHGDLDLTLASIQSLTVNATHTDVTIQPADYAFYNYQLVSKDGKIYVPRGFGNLVKKENNQSKVVLTRKATNPLIDVKTTFNTITIQ
jgi:hypothetical protein